MDLHFVLLVVCWSSTASCTVTSPEWFSNISTDLFSSSGNIKFGGLFPINEQTNNLSLITEPNSIKCESISAVIGPLTSEMVSVTGKLLGFFLMPQISYGATSDKFSDTHVYPSFFRTVPSDKWQVDAIARLMNEFEWMWVAVVGSEEEYGQRGVQQFSKMAENMSVCVAYQGLIPVYTDPAPAVRTIITNIRATEAKVVVVFALSNAAEFFFREVSVANSQSTSAVVKSIEADTLTILPFFQVIKSNLTGIWIASTSWSVSNRITSLPNIHTVGTIIGFIDRTNTLPLFSNYTLKLLRKLSEEKRDTSPPVQKPGDPFYPCPECWSLSPDNFSLVTDAAVERAAFGVYAAVYSAAQALHNLLDCSSVACKWGPNTKVYPWKLLEVLRNTSVEVSGQKIEFDENGNPNIGYSVFQWLWTSPNIEFKNVGHYYQENLTVDKTLFEWHTNTTEAPNSTCSMACAKGQVRRVKGFHSCCYDCIDCLAGTYQANDDDIQCEECPERQWSEHRSTKCTDPVYDYLTWDTPEALYMMLAGIALLICQGSVGVMFFMYRGTPMVMASGGALSFVALLSLMGACLSLLLFLGQPGDVVCRLQLPLISIFQTLAISIIMSISLQIFFVTEFSKIAASYLPTLRGPGSWLVVLICCAVQAGLCGWFVQEGPSLTKHIANIEINFVRAFLSCPISSDKLALMQGLNGAMALVSFMCTFMAVKPLHQYNLARDITFSTLIYCVIWVIFIPIYTGLTASVSTGSKNVTMVHVYFTMAGNLGLVVGYYFPKCYLLVRRSEFNTAEHFCTFLEGVPPTPPEEEPQPAPQADK
ncbi:unnamed protein product [Menidia menidia]|uniref:Taste receptor type 1 member 3 n=1 Tax=Menidia menidia TaxID=238744 RepID=A0A8S4BH58_9TELE|nr:unnamed protein product [Menidia menidia]